MNMPLSLQILMTCGLVGIILWGMIHEGVDEHFPSWLKVIYGVILIATPTIAIIAYLVLIWL